MKRISQRQIKKLQQLKNELEQEAAEIENLKSIYDEAQEAYQLKVAHYREMYDGAYA